MSNGNFSSRPYTAQRVAQIVHAALCIALMKASRNCLQPGKFKIFQAAFKN